MLASSLSLLFVLVKQTALQFLMLFAIFILGGLTLTLIARLTNRVFAQFAFPRLSFYLFGVVGIPFHEFSHAIFCRLFNHEITKIKWFDPAAKGGSHGAVEHRYNPWNLYQRMGHFFIGLGPTLLGPIVTLLLFYWLVPQGRGLFHAQTSNWHQLLQSTSDFTISTGHALFTRVTFTSYKFYAFLYLAICISSQIELSPADLAQVACGVPPLLITLFLGNLTATAAGSVNTSFHFATAGRSWHEMVVTFANQVSILSASFFIFATLMALISLAICAVFFDLANRLLGHRGINPFQNANTELRDPAP